MRVGASGLVTGYGAMLMDRDQLRRFRAAVDADGSGEEFVEITARLADRSLPVTSGAEAPLKTIPQGFATTHPRAEFLRWKGAVVIRAYEKADWMHTREALDVVREVWSGADPLKQWIDTHVTAVEKAKAS